jgi:predicted ATPase
MNEKIEIPGTFRLEHIRAVVQGVADGTGNSSELRQSMDLSPRHVSFAVGAARMLGWIRGDAKGWKMTKAGRILLAAPRDSDEEARTFEAAIRKSKDVRQIAPDLLVDEGPSFDELTHRISEFTGMAEASAKRGARVLLSWRRQALEPDPAQPEGIGKPDESPEPIESPDQEKPRKHDEPQNTDLLKKGILSVTLSGWGPFLKGMLSVGDLTVLTGPSGSGKSSFIDSLLFLCEALRHGPNAAVIARAQGFSELLFGNEGELVIGLEAAIPSPDPSVLRYQLTLAPDASDRARVVHEILRSSSASGDVLSREADNVATYKAEGGEIFVLPLSAERLALAAVPDDFERFPAALQLRDMLLRDVVRLSFHVGDLTDPCSPLVNPSSLIRGGGGLPLVLEKLADNDLNSLSGLKTTVRRAAPSVSEIWVREREADRHLTLEFRFDNGLSLPARRVSSGILRTLALATEAETCREGSLLMIDDFGSGLDPSSIRALIDRFAEPMNGQILLTSALSEVAEASTSHGFYRLEGNEGQATFVRVSG